jgi:hypothetical protein
MICLGFEIFDTEKAYEEVPSLDECPNLMGCCTHCDRMGLAYMDCEYCPPAAQVTYHPLMITRHHPNDARTQEKELAEKVVTQLLSSKVDEELKSFFDLVGKELYKGIDPIEEKTFFHVLDRMEIVSCCQMKDVPDMMARC